MSNKVFFADNDDGCIWKAGSLEELLEELDNCSEGVSDKKFYITSNLEEIKLSYMVKDKD